jgi:hypothetical protein
VIEAAPTLVGYYRLLLGAPQKTFYSGVTRLGPFKAMERSGTISERQRQALPWSCRAMCSVLADLVQQLSPTVTPRDIDELPLLTLGQQFQGANNVLIGQQAIQGVFQAIASVTADYVTERTEQALTARNAAGRTVGIVLAADPDVRIEEEFAGNVRDKVALEIKGGTDKSNAHNRAGEAEKSHQKAKSLGFRDFWTIIAKRGLSLDTLRRESPTTNSWFDVAQVLAQQGDDWEEFKSRLVDAVGIPSA